MNKVMIRLLSLSLLLTLALAAPAAAKAPIVGVGDQSPAMFTDPSFQQLGVKHSRLVLAWDWYKHPNLISSTDQWMAAAQAAGVRPLVAFNVNWGTKNGHRKPPSIAAYRKSFRLVRERYPFVSDYTAWNEANHTAQPTAKSPRLAARYYNAMRSDCRSCTIVAADVLDTRDMVAWVKKFKKHAKKPAHLGHPQLQGRQRRDQHHEAAAEGRQGPGLADRDRRHPAPQAGRRQPRRPQAHQGPAGQGRQARLQDRQGEPPHLARLLLRVGEEEGQPLGLGLRRAQRRPAPVVPRAQARPALRRRRRRGDRPLAHSQPEGDSARQKHHAGEGHQALVGACVGERLRLRGSAGTPWPRGVGAGSCAGPPARARGRGLRLLRTRLSPRSGRCRTDRCTGRPRRPAPAPRQGRPARAPGRRAWLPVAGPSGRQCIPPFRSDTVLRDGSAAHPAADRPGLDAPPGRRHGHEPLRPGVALDRVGAPGDRGGRQLSRSRSRRAAGAGPRAAPDGRAADRLPARGAGRPARRRARRRRRARGGQRHHAS